VKRFLLQNKEVLSFYRDSNPLISQEQIGKLITHLLLNVYSTLKIFIYIVLSCCNLSTTVIFKDIDKLTLLGVRKEFILIEAYLIVHRGSRKAAFPLALTHNRN